MAATRFTTETARAAGRKGGLALASKPGYMSALARKGGLAVAAIPGHMSKLGKKGQRMLRNGPDTERVPALDGYKP